MKRKQAKIIGLVGLPGAGKTTVAKYLEKKGYVRITLSDFIKKEGEKHGVKEFTREVLQDYGNHMREKFGPQILAQLACKMLGTNGYKKIVIDGIRNLYEVAFSQVENHFTLIGVTARPRIRYKRLLDYPNRPWNGSFSDFLRHEHREESLGSKEIGLRVSECLKKADYIIENNKTIQKLRHAVDGVLLLKKKS